MWVISGDERWVGDGRGGVGGGEGEGVPVFVGDG